MSNADTAESGANDDPATDEDEVVRINMRIPKEKYLWLQEELDSFTTDTGRFQHLIQFYSDHMSGDDNCD